MTVSEVSIVKKAISAARVRAKWSNLIRHPNQRQLGDASLIVEHIQKPAAQDIVSRLGQRDLPWLAHFLASCRELTFAFVATDRSNQTTVWRCGPDKRHVRSLLRAESAAPVRRRPRVTTSQARQCENTWGLVNLILAELDARDGVSYALYWRLRDESRGGLSVSSGQSLQGGWSSIRSIFAPAERRKLPRAHPPSREEVERISIEPVPPSDVLASAEARLAEYSSRDPLRPPMWRWDRAWALFRGQRYWSRSRDDEATGNALQFLRALLAEAQDLVAIREDFPSMLAAHEVRRGPLDLRVELESRILAGQSAEGIAESLGICSETVNAYEAMFFDVRDRLQARYYVHKAIIGLDWPVGPRSDVMAAYQRLIAYRGGLAAYETALPYLRNEGRELARLTAGETIQDPTAERLALFLMAAEMRCQGEDLSGTLRGADQDAIKSWTSAPNLALRGAFARSVDDLRTDSRPEVCPAAATAAEVA